MKTNSDAMKTRHFLANTGNCQQFLTSMEGKMAPVATPASTVEQHFLFLLNQSSFQRIYRQVVVATAKQVHLYVI